MSAIKEKIAKLLALSGSPNEKEAQEALITLPGLFRKTTWRSFRYHPKSFCVS